MPKKNSPATPVKPASADDTKALEQLLPSVPFLIEEARADCEFFIENYVKIENKSGEGDIAAPFLLWPGQKQALQLILNERLIIALKSRQIGISWLALAYSVWVMLNPGKSILVLSKTEKDAQELVRRVDFILRHLPRWFILPFESRAPGMMYFDSTAAQSTVYHPNSEMATFQSFTASAETARSFTGDVLILDEWGFQLYDRSIWKAAYPTVNRPNAKTIGISTIEHGSVFEEKWIESREGRNNFKRIFLGWRTDPRRDEKWYQDSCKEMGDAVKWEYPETEEDAFLIPGGTFFHEFKAATHVKKPRPQVPAHFRRYASLDYGLDGLAVLWYYIDNYGRTRIYRELYDHDRTIPQAAEMILAAMEGDSVYAFYAPGDLWGRRQDTGRSLAETFAGFGIYLSRADNRREPGWQAVKELLRLQPTVDEITGQPVDVPLLTLDEGAAPNLERCLQKVQRDPNRPNDISDKDHELTHMLDALRYFAVARTFPSDSRPTESAEDDEIDEYGGFLSYGTG